MIYDTLRPLMKKNWVISTTVALWFGSLLLALAMIRPAAAPAQPKVEEFFDTDYGYFFKYPAGWQIHNLPEGAANPDLRVMLQGPNGTQGQKTMIAIFNSFRLLGEDQSTENSGKPDVPADKPDVK